MKGECNLHGEVLYLYIKSAGAKLCLGCLKAGLYKQHLVDEAKDSYPQHFKEISNE